MRILRWLEADKRQQTSGVSPPEPATGHLPREGGGGGGVVVGFVDPELETLAAGRVATLAAKARDEGKRER